jgi:hypothetical protein
MSRADTPRAVRAAGLRRLLWILALASCGKADAGPASPAPSPVSTLGSVEVTAKLLEIPIEFPRKKLYDYVYVMKYRVLKVHRGRIDGDEILVGHYNPTKPRSLAVDKYSGPLGGSVGEFRAGDVHRLALEAPLDEKMPMVGLIDKYVSDRKTRYWALWADRATE